MAKNTNDDILETIRKQQESYRSAREREQLLQVREERRSAPAPLVMRSPYTSGRERRRKTLGERPLLWYVLGFVSYPAVAALLTALGLFSALTNFGGAFLSPGGGDARASSRGAAADAPAGYAVTYQSFRLYANRLGNTWGQVIVELENTGRDNIYLSTGAYELQDAAGRTVASRSGISVYPTVLMPGERAYLYDEAGFENLDPDREYTLRPSVSAASSRLDCLRMDITEFQLVNGSYGDIRALGRLTNRTGRDQDTVYVVAVLKDAAGKPVGQLTEVMTEPLPAGESRGFAMTSWALPGDVTLDTVAGCALYSFPRQQQSP